MTEPAFVPFPKEIADSSLYLNAWKTIGCVRKIVQLADPIIVKHVRSKLVKPAPARVPSRGDNHREAARIKPLCLLNEFLEMGIALAELPPSLN